MNAEMHAIIIKNAQIVEGIGAPAYRGDIAINGRQFVEEGFLQSKGKYNRIDTWRNP